MECSSITAIGTGWDTEIFYRREYYAQICGHPRLLQGLPVLGGDLEICGIIAREIRRRDPEARVCALPVADGGEGTVDAFLGALGGEKVAVPCRDPYGRPLTAHYGLFPDGKTAVIEMAAAAGLPLVGEDRRVADATTYGVGQLIAHALKRGAERILLGLGGSATNDGGCGAAAALGVEFLDAEGKAFVPVGGTLRRIAHIRVDGLLPALRQAEVIAMCDIDNPLCGESGAAAVFAPQKGADAATVRMLDEGLAHLAAVIEKDLGRSLLTLPGGGAAGGFGAGSVAFLGARLQMGIEAVLDLTDFDRLAADAYLVITGEGRLDSQSLRGKVVVGVARRARALGVPVVALVGSSETDIAAAYDAGVTAVFPINPAPTTLSEALAHARTHLAFTAENVLRFARCLEENR